MSTTTAVVSTKSRQAQAPPKYHEPVQGTVFHGDGREEELRNRLESDKALQSSYTEACSLQERSQRVLDAIHEFGKQENRYLMSVGETKGRQVEDLIKEKKPKLILELGAYVGFSAISFARQLVTVHPDAVYPSDWPSLTSKDQRAGYISLEKSPVYAQTAQTAVDLAGLHKAVKFVVGSSTTSLKSLRKTLDLPEGQCFDMVFLDHLKPLYTIDLKVMEEEGLVGPGTVLVADNVVKPGNPAYLSYVRSTPFQKRSAIKAGQLKTQPPATPNPTTEEEWQTAFRQGPIDETRWVPDEAEGIWSEGNPDLEYSSEMLNGWDPYTGEKDACEVSICRKA